MSVSQQDLFLFNHDLVWKTTRVAARDNTTQHEYNTRTHDTTRVQYDTTQVKHD